MLNPLLEPDGEGRYRLSGSLSFQTVPAVFRTSQALFAGEKSVVIDLAGVEHTDSAGLALLLDWLRRAKQHSASLSFENLPQQMINMAQVSGLDELVTQGI